MRLVIQRVREAEITVEDRPVAKIGAGALVLVGVAAADGPARLEAVVDELLGLRIFDDAAGRLNQSLRDVGGELLLVSQVTLVCGWASGRPSFDPAAPADRARAVFSRLVQLAQNAHPRTQAGVFQAEMQVRLVNDGPVTVVLDWESPA